jgi:membrane protein
MTLNSLRLALGDIITITRRAFVNFGEHECGQRSAALVYYALFSMFPLLLLSISLLGFLLEAGVPVALDAQTVVFQAVEQTLPQARSMVESILLTTRRARGSTSLVGLVVLAWSASNLFGQARLALNVIWESESDSGLGGALRRRVNAMGMVVGTGLLLVVFTIVNTSLDLIAQFATRLPWSDTLWPLALPVILASTTVILFALLYRFLPRAPLAWADVWPGAIVGGVGWEVVKKGFVWYTRTMADWGAIYGSIASVIALSLWLYLSAQVILFGAEFAAAYSRLVRTRGAVARVPVKGEPSPEPPAPVEVVPDEVEERVSLARGTVVGLVGAGVAGGLALVGVVAAVWGLLTRRAADDGDEAASVTRP